MRSTMGAIAIALLLSGIPLKGAENKPLTFRNVAMGEIEDKAATEAGFRTRWWPDAHFGFTIFKASDGNTLTVYYDDFNKPEEAKRFLDWKADKSFKVLLQSSKISGDGKPIEYRVERVPEQDRSGVEVMWVVGAEVHWIHAGTLDNALALERQYRH